MTNTATLAQMRTRGQRHAQMENTQFLQDSEWNNLLNLGGSELWDLLIDEHEDWCTSPTPATFGIGGTTPFVPGQTLYALPGDVLKILQVDLVLGPNWRWTMKRVQPRERNKNSWLGASGAWCDGYRQFGQQIEFLPTYPPTGYVEVRYAPQWTLLVNDSDGVPALIPIGWEEYMPLWAAVRAMTKQRVDPSGPAQLLADLRQRIIDAGADRDDNAMARVTDVSNRFGPYLPWLPPWRGP